MTAAAHVGLIMNGDNETLIGVGNVSQRRPQSQLYTCNDDVHLLYVPSDNRASFVASQVPLIMHTAHVTHHKHGARSGFVVN